MIVRRSGLECSRELRSTRASNPRTCSNAEQPNAADAIRIKCYFGNVGSARLIRSVRRCMDAEDSPPDEIRSAHDVAVRALALFSAVGVALGAPRTEVVPWLEAEGLWEELSPLEREFISREDAPERPRINFSWHSERL